jgi:hypothetical protein
VTIAKDRQIAQLHRFVAPLRSECVFHFVWPKPLVPITQNRKIDNVNATQTAARDLIGSVPAKSSACAVKGWNKIDEATMR